MLGHEGLLPLLVSKEAFDRAIRKTLVRRLVGQAGFRREEP